jgi:hypothetical protein
MTYVIVACNRKLLQKEQKEGYPLIPNSRLYELWVTIHASPQIQ